MMSEVTTTRGVPRVRAARNGRTGRLPRERARRQGVGKGRALPNIIEGAHALVGRFRVALTVVGAVLLVIVALYEPTQNLYQAWRVETAKQETLDELNASNEEFQEDIERLQTREGIEDEARKFGYVSEGETSIVVEGLTEEDAETSEDEADETPWYLNLTDLIFRYEG